MIKIALFTITLFPFFLKAQNRDTTRLEIGKVLAWVWPKTTSTTCIILEERVEQSGPLAERDSGSVHIKLMPEYVTEDVRIFGQMTFGSETDAFYKPFIMVSGLEPGQMYHFKLILSVSGKIEEKSFKVSTVK